MLLQEKEARRKYARLVCAQRGDKVVVDAIMCVFSGPEMMPWCPSRCLRGGKSQQGVCCDSSLMFGAKMVFVPTSIWCFPHLSNQGRGNGHHCIKRTGRTGESHGASHQSRGSSAGSLFTRGLLGAGATHHCVWSGLAVCGQRGRWAGCTPGLSSGGVSGT